MIKLKKLAIATILLVSSLLVSCPVLATQQSIYAAVARTASSNGADIIRTSERGATFVIVMSAVPGTDTVTFTVQGKDVFGNYYTLIASTAVVATGTTILTVCPGCAATTNVSANTNLPDVYRIITTHSASSSFTYSVGLNTTQ